MWTIKLLVRVKVTKVKDFIWFSVDFNESLSSAVMRKIFNFRNDFSSKNPHLSSSKFHTKRLLSCSASVL